MLRRAIVPSDYAATQNKRATLFDPAGLATSSGSQHPLNAAVLFSLGAQRGFSMRALILMLGLPDMATPQLVVFLAIVGVAMLLFGWISDMLLGDGAFGIIVNGLLVLAGAILGTLLWRKLGYTIGTNPALTVSFVALGSGLALLVALSTARRWI
jgi:uncharacterized membrane protein YeaQ/YmgE (transglycosylase-associated protein family)